MVLKFESCKGCIHVNVLVTLIWNMALLKKEMMGEDKNIHCLLKRRQGKGELQ